MRRVAVAGLAGLTFLAVAAALGPAQAYDRATGAWCLCKHDGQLECSFATLDHCLVSRLGTGGSCQPGPASNAAPQRRNGRV